MDQSLRGLGYQKGRHRDLWLAALFREAVVHLETLCTPLQDTASTAGGKGGRTKTPLTGLYTPCATLEPIPTLH